MKQSSTFVSQVRTAHSYVSVSESIEWVIYFLLLEERKTFRGSDSG